MNWILEFLPSWFYHVLVIIGVLGIVISQFAGFFSKFVPTLTQYVSITRIVSIIILLFGVWCEGVSYEAKIWESRVAEAKQEMEQFKQKANETNKKIETVYKDRIVYVDKVRKVVKTKIKEAAPQIDQQCTVDPIVVDILNQSAENKLESDK